MELMKVCRVEELFECNCFIIYLDGEAKYGVIFTKDLETAELIKERLIK